MEYLEGFNGKKIQIFGISFSEIEIKDIIKAWLAISLAFAIVMDSGFDKILISFLISSLTVGVGFIFHEMGHKILAQRYGAWAEFRAWNQMLILAIVFSFFGFIFAAPGAVLIAGRTIGKNRNGKISAMGPVMNFVIALGFFLLLIFFKEGIFNTIGSYGFRINTWLGLFNLIPFAMFDGQKIWAWSKVAYILLALVGFGMLWLG
jgi:Zn-dependent protease